MIRGQESGSGIQPVRCGCGGDAEHDYVNRIDCYGKHDESHYLICKQCHTLTAGNSFEEAVQRWNTAMSGNRVRVHPVILKEME